MKQHKFVPMNIPHSTALHIHTNAEVLCGQFRRVNGCIHEFGDEAIDTVETAVMESGEIL